MSTKLRSPARRRRGLGLFDTVLAIAVLSIMVVYGSQWSSSWVDQRIAAAEAQALAGLARAGRLWLEGDIADRRPPSGGTSIVAFAYLETAGVWPETQAQTTPYSRRTMSLTLYDAGSDRITVIASALDSAGLECRTQTGAATSTPRSLVSVAEGVSGVGVVVEIDNSLYLVGPNVFVDIAAEFPSGTSVQCGDMFALAHVYAGVACSSYLHRTPVAGCADANLMETDLDLGGQAIMGASEITATEAVVGSLEGSVEIGGDLTVTGDLSVLGLAEASQLVSTGTTDIAGPLSVDGDLSVAGSVSATGTVTAADLSFDGTISVAGTARLQDFTSNYADIARVVADEVSSTTGRFSQRLVVTDLFVENDGSGSGGGGCPPSVPC